MCDECNDLKKKIKRFVAALFEKWCCNEKHSNPGCGFCSEGIARKSTDEEFCKIESEYLAALGELQNIASKEKAEFLNKYAQGEMK